MASVSRRAVALAQFVEALSRWILAMSRCDAEQIEQATYKAEALAYEYERRATYESNDKDN